MPKKVTTTGEEPTGKAIRLISAKALKGFHSDAVKLGDRLTSLAGEVSGLFSEAVTKKYLNSKAYKICAWCLKQEPEKAAAFLASFDHMRKLMAVDEHAELQGRLFPDGDTADGEPGTSGADAVKRMADDAAAADNLKNVGRGPQTPKPH